MARSTIWLILLCLLVLTVSPLPSSAQESAVRGSLSGIVVDNSGAVVPDAKVTLKGPTGMRTIPTGPDGRFLFGVLTPGYYDVKVEKQGFKAATVPKVEVATGRTSSIQLRMAPGQVSQTVEVTAEAVRVDTGSTAVSTNLSDTFYQAVPLQRNVQNLFYVAPGVASGGASGAANPSISGGSGLENQYIADGVNITDAAFGGLGVFSRSYGSLASGINLSFVKEVQVKTAGYEPQYGKSTGGIVQIVTKSGTNQYHGAIAAYAAPKGFEATHKNPDDFGLQNPFGTLRHIQNYDVSFELGGPVPGLRDRLFFFGSYNPSETQRLLRAPANSGLFQHGDFNLRSFTNNYAAKLTLKLTDNHQLEASVFGDPSHTSTGPNRRLRMDNDTAFSKLDFGTRNVAIRLNSTLSPTWLFNASGTWGHNSYNETGFANVNSIQDETQTAAFPVIPGQRGLFFPAGLGFVEPTESNTYTTTFDTQKVVRGFGEHTFYVGYHMERPFYDGERLRSGPTYTIPSNSPGAGTVVNMQWRLRAACDMNTDPVMGTPAGTPGSCFGNTAFPDCPDCPLMTVNGYPNPIPVYLQSTRAEFGLNTPRGGHLFHTSGRYHSAYVNDSWAIGRHLTINAGLRWEQQRLTGEATKYTFTDNWSPRVGFAIDPLGNRKTKIFGNFGRYTYAIPLDMAERSLTNELDLFGLRVAPDFSVVGGQRFVNINDLGTVTPIVDAAHLLSISSVQTSQESTESIAPGTKMSYLDEYVGGIEHEFAFGIIGSVKYVKRDLKRIVEDTGGISPEAALAGITQVFQIANVSSSTDLFTNPVGHTYTPGGTPPAACNGGPSLDPVQDTFGNTLGAICFENNPNAGAAIPDGIPDGFTDARRTYWAVETELNKAFSKGWMMRVNYRWARLFGNFEGALRNDNGQTDPSISSLFDFTPGVFGLLGDQFRAGPLNTDKKHILNSYFSYVFSNGAFKNLGLGTGIRFESGTPINDLKAHPVYENAGEVPVGGRGKLGRTPNLTTVDAHADYTIPTSDKTRLVVAADFFNLFNQKTQIGFDQNEDIAFGTANADFLKPTNISGVSRGLGDGFQTPFNARLALKFVF